MKFGIDIPGTVKEAVSLDEANGNTLLQDAIKLNMNNSCIAFKLCKKIDKAPGGVGHTENNCYIIFYLKIDMTRKARFAANDHLTDVPTYMTYSNIVSRDTVHIGFLMADLNNLDFLDSGIYNDILVAPTKENIFSYAGDQWKSDKDRYVIFVRAL